MAGSGSLEIEQKFRVPSLDVVKHRLIALGAVQVSQESEWDTYLAHPVRNFAETDEALRIRSVGDGSLLHKLTYKGPRSAGEVKIRREIEFPAGGPTTARDEIQSFFESLGFAVVADVRKQRTSFELPYQRATVTVTLDQVDQLPPHVEVEVVSDDEASAVLAVQSVASLLELEQTATEKRSYLEMVIGD